MDLSNTPSLPSASQRLRTSGLAVPVSTTIFCSGLRFRQALSTPNPLPPCSSIRSMMAISHSLAGSVNQAIAAFSVPATPPVTIPVSSKSASLRLSRIATLSSTTNALRANPGLLAADAADQWHFARNRRRRGRWGRPLSFSRSPGSGARGPGTRLSDSHFDPPRLGFLQLGNRELEDAILQAGLDPRCVEFAAERELAAIGGVLRFAVDQLHAFGLDRCRSGLEDEAFAIDAHTEPFTRNAGQVGQERDAGLVFEYVHRRHDERLVGRVWIGPWPGHAVGVGSLKFGTHGNLLFQQVDGSIHFDAAGLGRLALGYRDSQDAVAIGGVHVARVGVVGQADHPAEIAGKPLPRIDADGVTRRGHCALALAGD